MSETALPAAPRPARGPLRSILGLFNSVWFGIFLMALIFLYMTIASAGLIYPTGFNIFNSANWSYLLVRKHPALGMTEMEVFSWWPFLTLLALFVVTMCVVTVKRIPLNTLNLGVWAIHTGIVVLALGSIYYFRTKIEGDTPVFRRHIVLDVPGADAPQRFVVRPNNRIMVNGRGGPYQFQIQSINPSWPILSGDDQGKTACSVNVAVTTPTQSFIRQMLVGYPQYTEDIIPGKGRALKNVGRKLLDEDLAMTFAYEPQTFFYLQDTAALYVREVGSREWIERPIAGLPHFSDHIADPSEIWPPEGDPPLEPNPLNIRVPAVDPRDPLGDLDVRITGRLHYVDSFPVRWVGGGSRLNPVINLRVEHPGGRDDVQLAAFDPQACVDPEGMFAFAWATTAEEVEALASRIGTRLDVRIPEADFSASLPIDENATLAQDPDAPFAPLGDTGWSYRVRGITRNLQMTDGQLLSVAIVEFQNADREITRWVADLPGRTRDAVGEHEMQMPDPAIETRLQPGALVNLIGGPAPDDLRVLINSPDNQTGLAVGEPLRIGPQATMTVTELLLEAHRAQRPHVVPKRLRNPNAGELASQVKLRLQAPNWSDARWLPFNRYALPDEQYAVAQFPYNPTVYNLPNGKRVEVMISRKRWPLPAAIALEKFDLKTHVGGFVPGNTTSVRDFISVLRTYRNDRWSDTFTASLNKPAEDGGLYFFQSEWDPANQAYTVLGVGNRNGVYIQLLGCGIAVAGMIYVFYVKPIIKRRRRQAVWQSVAAQRRHAEAEPVGV